MSANDVLYFQVLHTQDLGITYVASLSQKKKKKGW
jgi:hypothetical protein